MIDARKVRWHYRTNEWAATVEEATAAVRAAAERHNEGALVSVECIGHTPGGKWRFTVTVDRDPTLTPCPECGIGDEEYGLHEPDCPSGYPVRER